MESNEALQWVIVFPENEWKVFVQKTQETDAEGGHGY